MKKYTLIFILIHFGVSTFCQKAEGIQMDELLLEKGSLLIGLVDRDLKLNEKINSKDTIHREFAIEVKEAILKKAISCYKELIKKFPQSCFYLNALESKGYAEVQLRKWKEAEMTYQQILDRKLDDKTIENCPELSAEQLLSFHRRAIKALANICIEDKRFEEAINHLKLMEKSPYSSFCGNGHVENDMNMSVLYAKCYLGLKQTDKALGLLLPHLLGNEFTRNNEVVELTTETLLLKYSKVELKALFENAFKEYKTEKMKTDDTREIELHYITFLGVRMSANCWKCQTMKPEEWAKELEKICKASSFYKKLCE